MTGEAEPTGNGPKAVVVGAGMIGVCCALFLQRDGYRVTLIDRQGPGTRPVEDIRLLCQQGEHGFQIHQPLLDLAIDHAQ